MILSVGNVIPTNGSDSGIYLNDGTTNTKPFPQPSVNVKLLNHTLDNKEIIFYKNETITSNNFAKELLDAYKVIELDGKEYLLEKAIRGNVAIIQGYIADESGNIRYKGSTRNFNPMMASAADIVIAEVEKIVPAGEIGPNYVETPHIYVDYLVVKEEA